MAAGLYYIIQVYICIYIYISHRTLYTLYTLRHSFDLHANTLYNNNDTVHSHTANFIME